MYEIRINNCSDRQLVAGILAESGYAVYIEKRQRYNTFSDYDYFLIIASEPVLPKYKENHSG